MVHHDIETTSRRGLLNGLVNVATKSWLNGLQPNNHNSNAMVFPTITTAPNNSPTCRNITDNITMIDEQHRRLQQQRNEDHRLNILWYGGDDLHQQQQPPPVVLFESHNLNQSTDDWEKQPLRQRWKSRRQRYRKKLPTLPMVPAVWAAMLHIIYATAMAIVFYIHGDTVGSGWIWLRGIKKTDSNDGIFWWLNHISPTWYYIVNAICTVAISCFQYRQNQQCKNTEQRWYCYILLILFSTALLPSVPLAEVFNDNSRIITTLLKNTTLQQQLPHHINPRNFDDNHLSLYEGLWQVVFFVFVAYCLVLPMNANELSDKGNDENINNHNNDERKHIQFNDKGDHNVTKAILSFTCVSSFGHIALSAYISYHWYYQQHNYQDANFISSVDAIRQQVIANIMVLFCINLIGWILHQHVVRDRAELCGHKSFIKINGKNEQLRFTLHQQTEKLNMLLTSLLPRRVFKEMKYEIVTDAARSYNTIYGFHKNNQNNTHLHQPHLELQLNTPHLPRMYLKEYENVTVVYANVTKFWSNASIFGSHSESGIQQSQQLITLIDRLFVNLFHGLARRNHCHAIRLLGHRIYFVAGLPPEESYDYNDEDFKNAKKTLNDNGHARNAIQLGLDLINAIDTVVNDISRRRYGHKINLNIRVGVHSGRVACGVLGFARNTEIQTDINHWQYDVWGHDVHIASIIESSGRPGYIHVSQATVDQINKNNIADTRINSHVINSCNNSLDSNNSKYNYTFERCPQDQRDQFLSFNQIDTYFVVPDTMSINSSRICMDLQDNNKENTCFSEDIESLILHSVEHQLQLINLAPGQQLSTNLTTTAIEVPTASLINTAHTTNKMIMNRHRRSRYEQELLQAGTKLHTNTAVSSAIKHRNRWEEDVFGGYDNDNINKFRSQSDDEDLFRLAKSQLLLLCVVIALFVVNVTTMPWTLLLGITFITPFVVISGELIYVMALLIGWIRRPKFHSNLYTAAIIIEDDEYYNHYDSDNYSDCSSSSKRGRSCLRHLLVCYFPKSCLLLTWIFKPFRWTINAVMPNRRSLDNGDTHQQSTRTWYNIFHCNGNHSWFTWCTDNNRTSSWMSSDDSDIECRLGFRNENAVMAATAGAPSSQLQNRFQNSQPININRNHSISRTQQHRQPKKNYEDQERRTKFFWLAACSEMLVLLLICVLALLNAFTCEPVTTTTTNNVYDSWNTQNIINNDSNGFKIFPVNTTHQSFSNPLICFWPQYAIITCCLACVSVAIAFPIYYGALPILRMKIITLLVMICVFGVAFVHFTHRHVFIAALASRPSSCCNEGDNIINYQTINNTNISNSYEQVIHSTIKQDRYLEDQKLLKLQEQVTQQQRANLNTATATVYVIVFIAAIIAYSVYTHRLQKQRARLRVKNDRDIRRLVVLQTAHRRTLRTIIPDHIADSLQKLFNSNINNTIKKQGETRNEPSGTINNRLFPWDNQTEEHFPLNASLPLYHYSYRAVVVVFATIQQSRPSISSFANSHGMQDCHRQFTFLNDIFSEFDQLLDNQKFQGLVEKIKMVGTDTYMVAVGLQQDHEPERLFCMLQEKMRQRNIEQDGTTNINSINRNEDMGNDITNGYELYNIISANHIVFALDFIRDMRRILNRQCAVSTTIRNFPNLNPTQLTLRAGVNVGPVVAGLIGCNDGVWKRPQFDIWGNTVNVAKQMDITGVPGSTQVTNYIVEVMKSLKNPEYTFEIRNNVLNLNKMVTYFVRENFESHESHQSIQQQQHKHLVTLQSTQSVHRTMIQPLELDPLSSIPLKSLVTVHPQHSYYNAIVQQEQRVKCLESQMTTSPPPPHSPPQVNIRRAKHSHYPPYPLLQHSHNGEQQSEQRQRSRGGIQENQHYQKQNRRTPDTTTKTTYARPLQQQNNDRPSPQSCLGLVPHGLVLMFGDESQRVVPPTVNAKTIGMLSNDGVPATVVTDTNHDRQQQLRRPTVLELVNTTANATAVGHKNFDADRPLPAPPRSSDTVAGRQRHHHNPRRRRRRQQYNNTDGDNQELRPLRQNDDDRQPKVSAVAWPSSSSFRSPISAGSFISVPSSPPAPSSLSSSSESTDAGDTTTSHNNYNTTTGSSSSSLDGSYDRAVNRSGRDAEDYDTYLKASSTAVSPKHRYHQQHQQHQQLVSLYQWSPVTTTTTATANSSSVRRSSSFRSPLSACVGDHTTASSSSLRSPLIVGLNVPSTSGCNVSGGGTQSLNRRRIRPANSTAVASGNSSGRRRRRRQQQNSATVPGHSSPSGEVIADITSVVSNTTATETYGSSSSSPWKKQQMQRRQVTNKDQGTGTVGTDPDFTNEIRRILLLDHHRGNVRQQQQGLLEEEEAVGKYRDNKEKVIDDVVNQSLEQHKRGVLVGQKCNKNDKNVRQNKNDKNPELAASVTENISSMSSFNERERQITEQVKRQQAEVRRILQEHKNNVVAVVKEVAAVTSESVLYGRRSRIPDTTLESSEWSDDESVEPSSSLLDHKHQKVHDSYNENLGDYEATSLMTADTEYTTGGEGDGYTTGGDGDGYTTTGYTTDDAAFIDNIDMEMAAELPITSSTRQFDDNLSTINDTGLTDAEAALSDVNSMIYYNDCNDNTQYRSRRQSSLSSCIGRYASDSFCDDDDEDDDDDDDDDDDNNENQELFFQKRYDIGDEHEMYTEKDDNNCHYNVHCIIQQQQFLQPQSMLSLLSDDAYIENNKKLLSKPEQSKQLTTEQISAQSITSSTAEVATNTNITTTAADTSSKTKNISKDTSMSSTTSTIG